MISSKPLLITTILLGLASAACAKPDYPPMTQEQQRLIARADGALSCGKLSLDAVSRAQFYDLYAHVQQKAEWLRMVDPQNELDAAYVPADLVTAGPKITLRKEAMDAMNRMIEAAQKDGVTLRPISTYRTYKYQKGLYDRKPNNAYVAKPGQSQHQLGTVVDFNTLNPKDENLPSIQWLFKHAGEYGFSLSFPKGTEAQKETGYPYEPWHYRYITPEGVKLQDKFFEGSQHKTLAFLQNCVYSIPKKDLVADALKRQVEPLLGPVSVSPAPTLKQ